MFVVILAGGLATRLRPLTEKIPKSLVPVAGRPFIDYQLELLAHAGVADVLLCIGYLGEQIREHCGDGTRYGLRILYSDDGPEPRGTGGALMQARPLLPEQFFVMYGDSYLRCPYQDIWEAFSRATSPGLMTVYENENAYDRSNVVVAEGRVVVYDKTGVTPNMRHIDYGLSVFRKEVLSYAPPPSFAGGPGREPGDEGEEGAPRSLGGGGQAPTSAPGFGGQVGGPKVPRSHQAEWDVAGHLVPRALARGAPQAAFDVSELHRAFIARGELLAYEVHTRFYEVGSPAGLQEFERLVRSGELARAEVSA